LVEELFVNEPRMRPFVDVVPVHDLARVEGRPEHPRDLTAAPLATALARYARMVQLASDGGHTAAVAHVRIEDPTHDGGLAAVDDQVPVLVVVAVWGWALDAVVFPRLRPLRKSVPGVLTDHLTCQLREHGGHTQHGAPHRCRRVECFAGTRKTDAGLGRPIEEVVDIPHVA
jgi:hypothetical protein